MEKEKRFLLHRVLPIIQNQRGKQIKEIAGNRPVNSKQLNTNPIIQNTGQMCRNLSVNGCLVQSGGKNIYQ